MGRFIPELEITWLIHKDDYYYCVIKKPEPIPGDEKKTLMVQEGCTVFSDGRWYYWRLLKPRSYATWKAEERWDDRYSADPDKVVAARINGGKLKEGPDDGRVLPPRFKARNDNNWVGQHPMIVPNHLTDEMLGDLMVAHNQLSEEVREGKKPEHAS